MKKITTFLSLTFIIIFTSCDIGESINNAIRFNYTQTANFSIPGSSVVDLPFDIATPSISSSSERAFDNNNTSAGLVDEITLDELEMTINSPDDRTFSFLESIEIYISTENNSEILLAEKQDIPETVGATLQLDTSGENLKPYLTEEAFDLRYELVTREATGSETDIIAVMTFDVSAEVF